MENQDRPRPGNGEAPPPKRRAGRPRKSTWIRGAAKGKLLDAARALATETTCRHCGRGGVTAAKVAEAAGVNSALIFYYFGSMAGLRRAAAEVTEGPPTITEGSGPSLPG